MNERIHIAANALQITQKLARTAKWLRIAHAAALGGAAVSLALGGIRIAKNFGTNGRILLRSKML